MNKKNYVVKVSSHFAIIIQNLDFGYHGYESHTFRYCLELFFLTASRIDKYLQNSKHLLKLLANFHFGLQTKPIKGK